MSEKLELISFKLCPYVQRAIIVLNEKNIDFDVTYIDLMNKPDWFNKISPLGQVPVLRVVDEVLFESSVIQEYVDEVTPPSLHPKDSLIKAKNRAWISFGGEFGHLIFKMNQSKDEASFNAPYQELLGQLLKLEAVHSGENYFNGKQFSLIDAAYAPMFMRFDFINKLCGIDFLSATPKMKTWSNALLEMDSVQTSTVEGIEQIFTGMLKNVDGYLASKFK